jgi:hypothetical protein
MACPKLPSQAVTAMTVAASRARRAIEVRGVMVVIHPNDSAPAEPSHASGPRKLVRILAIARDTLRAVLRPRPPLDPHRLPALLVLATGCFSEPEPIVGDDGETVVMCIQAPCSATEGDPSTGPAATSTSEATTLEPADSTSGGSADPSSDDTASTGPVAVCGDGEINQPTEMCDSTPGCLPDCTFESYECNPLGDAGCVAGLRCGAIDVPAETFGCMPPGRGAVGSECSGLPANDSDCAAGLTCLSNFNTALCDIGNCCVEYCDLTDPTSVCSGGAVCRQFFIDSMYQGLEHLGFCGEP